MGAVRFWCFSGRISSQALPESPSHPRVSDESGVLSLWRSGDPKLSLVGAALTHILGMES